MKYRKRAISWILGVCIVLSMCVGIQMPVQAADETGDFKIEFELAKIGSSAVLYVDDNDETSVRTFGGPDDGYMTFHVWADGEVERTLSIYYAAGGDRSLKMSVNGAEAGIVDFSSNGNWDLAAAEPKTVNVKLQAGDNEIKISGNNGEYGPNIYGITAGLTPEEEEKTVQLYINSLKPEQTRLKDKAKLELIESLCENLDDKNSVDTEKLQAAFDRIEELEAEKANMEGSEGRIKVTCVGDSITQGMISVGGKLDLHSEDSYPAQLQEILGYGYDVLNVGISGTFALRVGGVYNYSGTQAYKTGLASDPDIAIIMFGTNDASLDGQGMYGNQPLIETRLEELERDYRLLIEEYEALESNPKIILSTSLTCRDKGTRRTNYNLEEYVIPIVRKVAAEKGLQLLDAHTFTGAWTNEGSGLGYEYLSDGTHPNEEGYTELASFFANAVRGYEEGFTGDLQVGTEYTITSKATEKALTIENYSGKEGYGLCQRTNHNYESQVWELIAEDYSGYYQFKNKSSGLVLGVPGDQAEPDTQICQYEKNDEDNEKFMITATGDGYWKISAKTAPKLSLSILDNSDENDAPVVLGENAEQWRIEAVGAEDQVNPNPVKTAQPVIDLIAALGTVTLESEADILAAREEYKRLTEDEKECVSNYYVLTRAERRLTELKNDTAAAQKVQDLINGIGTVTLTSESLIKEAMAAYNSLTEEQKKLVPNFQKLTEAETAIETLKKTESEQMKYQVVNEKKKTVKLVSVADKNTRTLIIPDTVKLNGKTYKVVEIGANLMKGSLGLTKVTIGKNVTKIGNKAFNNCKNLKTITIKATKLTTKTVGKNAFKGISAKANIKVPKAKLDAYKKLLKAKGVGSKAKIKK